MLRAPPGCDERIDLRTLYNLSLKTYRKVFFDCFRRNKRISFDKHGLKLQTTIAQLRFFRTIIDYGVLDYVTIHLEEIESAMAEDNEKRKLLPRKRRYTTKLQIDDLSGSHVISVSVTNV